LNPVGCNSAALLLQGGFLHALQIEKALAAALFIEFKYI
jgi:hypothetical protein